MANPYNLTINWFQLFIERESIYKITCSEEDAEPDNYFIRYEQDFYSLEKTASCQEVGFEGELRKRCIGKAFRKALKTHGFAFKGRFGAIAYYPKGFLNEKYRDIFGSHTGFEYRIWQNHDGEELNDYLILDPHIAFIMKASIHDLSGSGMYGRKISVDKLKNYAVRVAKEAVSEADENLFGIDGILSDAVANPNGTIICDVWDQRRNKLHKFDSKDVYLESRPEIIRDVVLKELGISFDVVKLQQERSFLVSKTAAKDRLLKTLDIVNKYLSDTAKIFPLDIGGNQVRVDPKLTTIRGIGYPKHGVLKESRLLFDKVDSSAVHLQAYHGLKNYGSYTKDKSEIRIALLGSRYGVDQLKKITSDLNKGSGLMPDGMLRFFNTKLNVIDEEIIQLESLEGYVEGAKALTSRCGSNGESIEVAMVHLPKGTSEFNYNTPYYNVKPVFLENGITSQFITQNTLQHPEWSYTNIGSAMFAKSGAYPWVLAEDIADFDLIMGVGLSQAISMINRAGANSKYIGFANVFDKQGRWMFFETTTELYNMDDPVEQLKNLVGNTLDQYKRVKGQYPKSLALHYYQRFSVEKIDAVNDELRAKLGNDFRIAYITIDKSHPMRLYDINIGDCSYPRGHYALLSEDRLLLSTTGFTDLANKRLGTPQILNISAVQFPEKFVDISRIAQHVLALTRLNYKTLTPVVGEPVTLLFSGLAAKFMASFSETQFGNAKRMLSNKINNAPWFL